MKSAYIHIPFCKSICSYCDFCKMFYNEKLVDKYLDALNKEIELNYKKEKLKTIYIGGGTPSSLNKNQLNNLFEITNKLNLDSDYEFTIEANINDINEDFLKLCSNNKVNRLSIGIETINKEFYKLLNRYNDINVIKDKIKLSKKYFNNINVDLMYGFYGETIEELDNDLNLIKELDVNHISIYSLIIEENTVLYINKQKQINDEIESNMYYHIIDYLTSIGYNHYEISNFSKEGFKSIHNLNYWNNNNYYGFGLGASGYIGNTRYTNTRSINKYLELDYIYQKEILDNKTIMEEELICGLRKIEGISKEVFKKKYNKGIREVFNIDKLINDELLVENNDYIYIPKDKLYVSNSIMINFIM